MTRQNYANSAIIGILISVCAAALIGATKYVMENKVDRVEYVGDQRDVVHRLDDMHKDILRMDTTVRDIRDAVRHRR